MRLRKRVMAILLTAILLVTNTLPVVAAGDSTEPVPTVKPTATLTIETVGEGTVKCTGDGVTETGDNTYSVPSETRVLAQAQPSDGFTWKQTLLNGSEVKDSFTMPETDSILKVVFESFPKEEKVVEEASEDQPVETDVPQAENLPEEKVEQPETISSDDEEYVVNSKGIKVKKSLLCDDLNCLEKHVGATLDPDTFPVQEVSLPYSQFVSSSDERILEDVYVGMKTSGSNCAVHFWGTPGTGTGHFELQIHDGGLAGATGTGWCVNHGAANPGEYSWVICTYEATCTSVSGNVATWSVTATPPGAWDGESFINGLPAGYQRVGMNVRVQFEEAKGNLEIAKSSAKPEFTNGNDNYSLANEIEERESIGHWEMDTVRGQQGKSKKSLLVLTERKSRIEIIDLLKDGTSKQVIKALNRLERELGEKKFREIFKTITVDNGVEFSDWKGMERSRRNKRNRTKIYYCHPYSSYERGSNENQNKLIRYHIPKGVDFDDFTKSQVKIIEAWINEYPRKLFSGKTSADIFEKEFREKFWRLSG